MSKLIHFFKVRFAYPALRLGLAFHPAYSPAILPSGRLVVYRRLDLYELDRVEYDDPGPFTYTYINPKTGKEMERVYDISQWPSPPEPPATPEHECDPDSYDAALWHVYNTYQSALLQRMRQSEAAEDYAHNCARYILDKVLVWGGPLQDEADYNRLYELAFVPEVSLEDLQAVLAECFQGWFRQPADFRGAETNEKGEGKASHDSAMGRPDDAGVGAGQGGLGAAAGA